MADDEDAPEPTEDAAAEAFEQLRAEVAQLRAAMEAFPSRFKLKAPDYAPTLGAMAKSLEKIESHPALLLTPERYRADAYTVAEGVRQAIEPRLQQVMTTIAHASGDVRRFAGELRTREAQRTAVITAAAGGLAAGAILWSLLSGPAARALPASWHIPEKMAAATLHLDRWTAGSRLMESANPSGWAGMAAASQVWQANALALAACARSAEKREKAQVCKVIVRAPAE